MKAILFHKESGILTFDEREVPQLGRKDVLIKVHYCAFCHHDLSVMDQLLNRGVKKEVILGHELSGVIQEIGPEVSLYRPGDRVISFLTNSCGTCDRCLGDKSYRCRYGQGIGHSCDGGFAEYVAVSEHSIYKIHDNITLKDACMLGCPIGIIEEAFFRYRGEFGTAVILGATGGIGIHGVQKCAGLFDRVIALTSKPTSEELLLHYGASDVVVYDPTDSFKYKEIVNALTDDKGADLFLDPVGSSLFNESLNCVSQYGCLMILGDIAGEPIGIHIADMLFKDLDIICSTGSNRLSISMAEQDIILNNIKPVIFDIVGLEDLEIVRSQMRNSAITGRILIKIAGEE
tara:strand:- start:8039 stop:9076 length:1038 start_codon:yes stop_codon:yes gene_type:complete